MKATTAFLISVLLFSGDKEDIFSTKNIEERMVKVEEGLFANKYETTNAEYREFLEWAKSYQPQSIEKVKIHHDGWNDRLGAAYSKNYFTNKGFNNYPVVNITHEAAQAFCEWLTDQYNQSNDKKKKFTEVKFRLPTGQEWVAMAMNGSKNSKKYPWKSPYMRNRKGEYLANFRRISNGSIKLDINDPTKVSVVPYQDKAGGNRYGAESMTNPVNQYLPTGAGLHQLAGNAAEMLAEKGRTKGGSWGSSGYYMSIHSEDEFEGFITSPYVGFRYVMEVVEE